MWLLFFTPTIERDEEMKLLIIDDEEGIRSSLKSLFRSEGYTLLEADDGLSGERLLREERPEVTITDIRLPGKSGLDLLETVRKPSPQRRSSSPATETLTWRSKPLGRGPSTSSRSPSLPTESSSPFATPSKRRPSPRPVGEHWRRNWQAP